MPLFEVLSGLFHHTSKYNPRYLNSGAGASSGNVVINTANSAAEQDIVQAISPAVLQKHYQKAMNKYTRKQGLQQEQTEQEEETEEETQTSSTQSTSSRSKPVMPDVIPGVDLNDKAQRHIVKKRISRQVQKILERSGDDIENLDMNQLLQKLSQEMAKQEGGGAEASQPQPKQQEPDIAEMLKHFQNQRPQPKPQPKPQPQPSQEDFMQQLLATLQAQQAQPVPPPPTPSPPAMDPEFLRMLGEMQAQQRAAERAAQQVRPEPAPAAPQQPQMDPNVLQLLQQLLPGGGLNLASLLGETASSTTPPPPPPPTSAPRPPREPYRGHLYTKNQFVSHGTTGGIDTGVSTNGGKI